MTFALSATADIGGVVVAAMALVAFLALVALLWRRTVKVETKLGSIQSGVDEISRQVNHVPDPERSPTVREHVEQLSAGGAVHAMLCEVRADVAEMKRDVKRVDRRVSSVETASIMHGERLGEIGTLARQTADTLGRHLEERDR